MATKMIEKLTAEQEALMHVYKDKWLKIGLATGPVDFEKAKAAAIKAYKLAGLKPPKRFYVTDGPFMQFNLSKALHQNLRMNKYFRT